MRSNAPPGGYTSPPAPPGTSSPLPAPKPSSFPQRGTQAFCYIEENPHALDSCTVRPDLYRVKLVDCCEGQNARKLALGFQAQHFMQQRDKLTGLVGGEVPGETGLVGRGQRRRAGHHRAPVVRQV